MPSKPPPARTGPPDEIAHDGPADISVEGTLPVNVASTSAEGASSSRLSAPASTTSTAARQPQSVADVVAASVGARRERKRKRIHYSCAECHRRKSKCDRKTPCQPCIDRGIGDTCRPFEDGDEHGDARDRIQRLEDIVEGLAVAQASLAKELAALQHARLDPAGSLARARQDWPAATSGLDTATMIEDNGSEQMAQPNGYPHSTWRGPAPGPLSLSHGYVRSPEDSRDDSRPYSAPRPASYNGSRHDQEHEDDAGHDDSFGHGRSLSRRRRLREGHAEEDATMSEGDVDGRAPADGEGDIVTKVEATDNFEGGLTVEGGMHGEANWYGALALPSVSRSVVRTEIRGEHLELHADLPRCPASVMLYRLIHEGGAPPDILQQLMADLPAKETCDELVRLYFRDINWTRLPIHEGTFRHSYDELMEFRSGRSLDETGETGGRHAPFLALLFVILATVKRSQPEDMGSEEDARTGSIKLLHGFKKTAAIAASIRIDHIDMLVAHLLAARWYIVNRHSGEAWAALGFAIRAAQAMGLHRDGSKLGLDAVTTERRRRLFSLVQYLDSTTSILLGRPLGINPAHCDTQPPSDIDIDTMPRASRPFNAVIYRDGVPPGVFAFVAIRHEMNRLTGQIVEHFQNLEKARSYSDVLTIDQDLRNFRDALPGPYRHIDADTSFDAICPWLPLHRYLLSIEIFYFRITLHRPYMLRSSDAKYDFSRRAAIESAKADRQLREEYRRTVEWPSSRCRRTFMGGLYRLFNATLIFAVALLQDPRGPDAADFVSYLDEFIERHREADRTDAATRREVKIIELFRAKALDPTWCAMTATGTTAHPSKALLAIKGTSSAKAPTGPRRSNSRSALNPGYLGAGPSSLAGSSAHEEQHDPATSSTGGIHFGDERSVIHAGPITATSVLANASGLNAIESKNGQSASIRTEESGRGNAATTSTHARGYRPNTSRSEAGSTASGHSPAGRIIPTLPTSYPSTTSSAPSAARVGYVTTSSENGTGGIIVPGTLAPHDSSSSSFPSLFGSAVGGSVALGRSTPTGLWAPAGLGSASGSTPTPAPDSAGLGGFLGSGSAAFDFSGGLSLNSFGGGGGFGNSAMMGLGDADFAQSLFDQLGVSLDQFGLASGSGTVMNDASFVGTSGNGATPSIAVPATTGPGAATATSASAAGIELASGSFNHENGRLASEPAQAVGASASLPGQQDTILQGSAPSGSGPSASSSNKATTYGSAPEKTVGLDASGAHAHGSGPSTSTPASGSEWAGVRAWGPLVEAIALATSGSQAVPPTTSAQTSSAPSSRSKGPVASSAASTATEQASITANGRHKQDSVSRSGPARK